MKLFDTGTAFTLACFATTLLSGCPTEVNPPEGSIPPVESLEFYEIENDRGVQLHSFFNGSTHVLNTSQSKNMLLASASYSNASWETLVNGRLASMSRLESDYAEFISSPVNATETHEEFICDLYGSRQYSASKNVDSDANIITYKFKTDANRCVSELNDNGYDYEVNHGVFEKSYTFYLDDSDQVERIDFEEVRTGVEDLITTDAVLQENLDNIPVAKAEAFDVTINATWLATTEETVYHIDGSSISNFVFYEDDIRNSLSGTVTYTTTDDLVIPDNGGFYSMIYDLSIGEHILQETLTAGSSQSTCDGSPC